MGVSPMRVDWNGKRDLWPTAPAMQAGTNEITWPYDKHGRDAHATVGRVPQVAVRRDLCLRPVSQTQVYEYADLWHRDPAISEKHMGNEIYSSGDEIHSSPRELHSSRDEIHSLRNEIHSSRDEIQSSRREIHSLRDEIYSSRREIHSSRDEIHSLRPEIHSSRREIQRPANEIMLLGA
ncbi:MAG TPA: hypothetical protein VGN72_13975 [Tepidisphaeraceae bacterium]|jgi:septal ring factor EnvC (AmiA/AmiB activator)|nr:hypothetical protein [Tepidisphaeraceae bacterium]